MTSSTKTHCDLEKQASAPPPSSLDLKRVFPRLRRQKTLRFLDYGDPTSFGEMAVHSVIGETQVNSWKPSALKYRLNSGRKKSSTAEIGLRRRTVVSSRRFAIISRLRADVARRGKFGGKSPREVHATQHRYFGQTSRTTRRLGLLRRGRWAHRISTERRRRRRIALHQYPSEVLHDLKLIN